ncbi:FAD-dependent monooxygenase OpS4 [Fulvia fulva]|uniref:FAD-dependent monooxygenase OpS4 n=1 Tax=Passalora fulva TaxID=5499 RepID=A0A9Q8PC66_PASFU|nr:FAD-dependent monooxygenase OpS4 [Fulvia fulva]UJO19777.1 FAD-dependent monooxygenase OpS4 [Fulvia fulva]
MHKPAPHHSQAFALSHPASKFSVNDHENTPLTPTPCTPTMSPPPPPPPSPLTITIIGAGIAGLTLALTLRRLSPQHHIHLLEKQPQLQETGNALLISPNASRILLRLGWDPSTARANDCNGMVAMNATGEVVLDKDMRIVAEKYGSPWLLAHRRDLHDELRRLVLEPEAKGKGRPGVLELGVRVREIDVESGRVVLEDGRVLQGDVVVGADGNRSFCRRYVEPEAKLYGFGKDCYRWLVDRDVLAKDPGLKDLEVLKREGYFAEIGGERERIVMYPCRGNTTYNMAVFVPTAEDEAERGDSHTHWDQEGSKKQMEQALAGFSPTARRLVASAGDDLKVWPLLDMNHLKRWTEGRLALIGDAAHPFLPFLGQGAAQAIEDAASLGLLLADALAAEDVPGTLRMLDEIRRERIDWIREQGRINGADAAERPPREFMIRVMDACFSYNVWSDTEKKLEASRGVSTTALNTENNLMGHRVSTTV